MKHFPMQGWLIVQKRRSSPGVVDPVKAVGVVATRTHATTAHAERPGLPDPCGTTDKIADIDCCVWWTKEGAERHLVTFVDEDLRENFFVAPVIVDGTDNA